MSNTQIISDSKSKQFLDYILNTPSDVLVKQTENPEFQKESHSFMQMFDSIIISQYNNNKIDNVLNANGSNLRDLITAIRKNKNINPELIETIKNQILNSIETLDTRLKLISEVFGNYDNYKKSNIESNSNTDFIESMVKSFRKAQELAFSEKNEMLYFLKLIELTNSENNSDE